MTPSGVSKYSHKSLGAKGKAHPSSIKSGLAGVDKQGGGPSPNPSSTGSGDGHIKGVVRGDGTETLQGTKVSKKHGSGTPGPGSGSKNYPKDLRQHAGTKAPKSVKQP